MGFHMSGRSITVGRLVVFRILTLLIVVVGASSLQTMHALNLAVNNIAAQAWPFCSHPGLFEGAGKETVPKPGRVYV